MVGPTWELFACILQKPKTFEILSYFPYSFKNMSPIMSDFLLIVLFCVFFQGFKIRIKLIKTWYRKLKKLVYKSL